jgi:hypothetical protein
VFVSSRSCSISSRSCLISSRSCVHAKMSACFHQVSRSCYKSRKEKIDFDQHYFNLRSALFRILQSG